MSGLAGLLALSRQRVDGHAADRMAQLLGHRGPGGGGQYRSPGGRAALGCRHGFDDPAAEEDGFYVNESRDIRLICDGMIYNHRPLRHSLELTGHVFRTTGGAEAVLHAYEQYGPGFLDHIQGMFAFALWDERNGRLVLARDRMGKKPLYYMQQDGCLAFASEIKALAQVLPFRRRLDPQALSQYLTFGYVMPPLTLFDGVYKLGPGESLTVEGNGALRRSTYWTPLRDGRKTAAIQSLSAETHAANLRRLLESAVADRLAGERPTAAMVAGADSSAVAAIMARLLGRSIDLVSVHLPGEDREDEARQRIGRIESLAESMGGRSHAVTIDEVEAIAAIPDYLLHLDEPLADPAMIRDWWAARALRAEGISVAQTGEGADEILMGRDDVLRLRRLYPAWRRHNRLPRPLSGLGRMLMPWAVKDLARADQGEMLRRRDGEPLFLGCETLFHDAAKPAVMGPELRDALRRWPALDAAQDVHRQLPPWLEDDPLAFMSAADLRMRLAERTLMRADKMAMAHGVELRSPFLDDQLVDYALAIPGDQRAPGGKAKHLLGRAIADLLPEGMAERRSRPRRPSLLDAWFQGDLGRLLEFRLGRSNLFLDGILDPLHVRNLLAAHRLGKISQARPLWALLLLAEWYDGWSVEGMAAEPAMGHSLPQQWQAVAIG